MNTIATATAANLDACHAMVEAAVAKWDAAKADHDEATADLAKLRDREPTIRQALHMGMRELQMQRHWALTGTRPSTTQGGAVCARRVGNWNAFHRSEAAQDWHARLTLAEAAEPASLGRLAEATRTLATLVGYTVAARVTGLTEPHLRGLSHSTKLTSHPRHEQQGQ